MPRKNKLTEADQAFIRERNDNMTPKEMATKLRAPLAVVKKFVESMGAPGLKTALRNTETWKRLREEFSAPELKLFEEKYVQTMAQFEQNVLPTEEVQITQVIKLEILQSRNLIEQRQTLDAIERKEDERDLLIRSSGKSQSEETRSKITDLDYDIAALRAGCGKASAEYTRLQERIDNLMKTLKGTRDQRFRDNEDRKVSFLGLLKSLDIADVRNAEAKQMELVRIAAAKEKIRISTLHKFGDSKFDRPLLTPESLDLD